MVIVTGVDNNVKSVKYVTGFLNWPAFIEQIYQGKIFEKKKTVMQLCKLLIKSIHAIKKMEKAPKNQNTVTLCCSALLLFIPFNFRKRFRHHLCCTCDNTNLPEWQTKQWKK